MLVNETLSNINRKKHFESSSQKFWVLTEIRCELEFNVLPSSGLNLSLACLKWKAVLYCVCF